MDELPSSIPPWSDPLQVLQALAEARYLLYRHHEFDMLEAIGPMFDLARKEGLDPDVSRAIINRAFEGILDEHERADR